MSVFAVVLIEFCLVILAAIQWMRFVATGARPAWASFPGKALWGWFWRGAFGVLLVLRGYDLGALLASRIAGMAPWQLEVVGYLAAFLVLVLMTPFALSLCAIALGVGETAAQVRIKTFHLAGRQIYLGAALIVGPCVVTSRMLNLAMGAQNPRVVQAVATFADLILLFAAVILAMTYVNRVYARAAMQTLVSAESRI